MLMQQLALKNQVTLVSIVSNKSNYKAYLAYKDQEVEIKAGSKRGQVFIQKKAAHRLGIR
jgi:hypothetical protein